MGGVLVSTVGSLLSSSCYLQARSREGSVHLYLLRQTLPPTVGDLAWTFTSPFLSSSSSLQGFLIIGFCKEGRGEKEENPTALHSSACWLSSEKTQRCYTFIPFLSFPSSNTLIKGKETNGRKGMLLGEGTALTSN